MKSVGIGSSVADLEAAAGAAISAPKRTYHTQKSLEKQIVIVSANGLMIPFDVAGCFEAGNERCLRVRKRSGKNNSETEKSTTQRKEMDAPIVRKGCNEVVQSGFISLMNGNTESVILGSTR
mmetsp:Transcript_15938/g.36909  ORF Transcript_15938/g.36909 Transcript_15938/m.36909 type:complete len:122 (-) Transcript_15938:165-530(-)